MNPLSRLRDFLWRVTHPREVRRQREELYKTYQEQHAQGVQLAADAVIAFRQRQTEWHDIVVKSDSTTDALLHAIGDELSYWTALCNRRSFLEDNTAFEEIEAWHLDFQSNVASHPNFSLNLFDYVGVGENTIEGFLRNPSLPLILLECPDFVNKLGLVGQAILASFVLRREGALPVLIDSLRNAGDVWLALEARTHILANDASVPVEADLQWLENQIMDLLRNESVLTGLLRGANIKLRCLICELMHHGVISKTVEPYMPGFSSEDFPEVDLISHPLVVQLIEDLDELAKQEPQRLEEAFFYWIVELLVSEERSASAPYLNAALCHPNTPRWTDKYLTNGVAAGAWRVSFTYHRLVILQRGKATSALRTQYRDDAIEEALSRWDSSFSFQNTVAFYFLMRDLPDLFQGKELNPRYKTSDQYEQFPPKKINEADFLVRLAIALRLNDADPDHDEWREILHDDPNRYVRAAARKEIAWHGGQHGEPG